VVVVVRVGGRVALNFACFRGTPPPGSLRVRYFYSFLMFYSVGWFCWTQIWCRNGLQTRAIRGG